MYVSRCWVWILTVGPPVSQNFQVTSRQAFQFGQCVMVFKFQSVGRPKSLLNFHFTFTSQIEASSLLNLGRTP